MRNIASWKKICKGHVVGMVMGLTLMSALQALATPLSYYVGVDGLATLATGTYAGKSNPNYGRLTFLFAHPDEATPAHSHYHGIGAWSYTGPADAPVVNPTNANNRIPETFSGQAPLPLFPGQGAQAGTWGSRAVPGLEYSDLRWGSTHSLSGAAPGSLEDYLFKSSSGRWSGTMKSVDLALKLVDLTPGLHVADHTGLTVLSAVGQVYRLGAGDVFSFSPTFITTEATRSRYSASFRLVDLSGTVKDSGTFHMDFSPVPEPATIWLFVIGLTGLVGLQRRRAATRG